MSTGDHNQIGLTEIGCGEHIQRLFDRQEKKLDPVVIASEVSSTNPVTVNVHALRAATKR